MTAPTFTWAGLLTALLARHDLSVAAMGWAMREIMAGEATPAQIAAFAMALRAKGETLGEIDALVDVMLSNAAPVRMPGPVVDVVGTGGDRAHTVNISTMAALVVAACGIPVGKHGNRAASSACGSADVLEALGVVIDLPPAGVEHCVLEAGIGFFFAPVFHPGMRHTAVARREMGVATVFNFLGPLTNPGRPVAAAVGCADARMAPLLAGVLARRGVGAIVFRGDDGLDELTTTTTSSVWLAADGRVVADTLDPTVFGLERARTEDLRGGDAELNASVVRRLVAGEPGPVRDAVVLNAAAAIVAESGLSSTAPTANKSLNDRFALAIARADEAIEDSSAAATLDRWIQVSQSAKSN
ncbi:MAG: anthranilate phosphoribosyltransferase [Actinomycetota bacterium]|nr:anthranilate phosphoribosyltransferase [Actinomycetota bacterium]